MASGADEIGVFLPAIAFEGVPAGDGQTIPADWLFAPPPVPLLIRSDRVGFLVAGRLDNVFRRAVRRPDLWVWKGVGFVNTAYVDAVRGLRPVMNVRALRLNGRLRTVVLGSTPTWPHAPAIVVGRDVERPGHRGSKVAGPR